MVKDRLLRDLQNKILNKFKSQEAAHDYWHIKRVVKTAKYLAEIEGADSFIVETAAWCHDVGDHKLNELESAESQITQLLNGLDYPAAVCKEVVSIVESVSYSKSKGKASSLSIEAQVVQDADRLDAVGAIGIARCFAYAGHKGHAIYQSEKAFDWNENCENFNKKDDSAIAHFYEKLLLLKDLLNTASAKAVGEERHVFMEHYLKQFSSEWNTFND